MTNQSTIDKLIEMRLSSMADSFLSIPGDFTPRFRKMETGIPE